MQSTYVDRIGQAYPTIQIQLSQPKHESRKRISMAKWNEVFNSVDVISFIDSLTALNQTLKQQIINILHGGLMSKFWNDINWPQFAFQKFYLSPQETILYLI